MPRARALALLLALALVSAACGRKPKDEVGEEVSKNPVAAISQVSDAMQKAQKAAEEVGRHKPVPPVAFAALLPFLPPVPDGWRADEPHGDSSTGMGFAISTARRDYRGPGTMRVTITDSGYQPMVLAGVTMAAQFARETTEGYERGVTLDGNPGVEHWRKDGAHAELTLIAGQRYIVAIEASHVPEGFPRKVWESMDRSGLSNLK